MDYIDFVYIIWHSNCNTYRCECRIHGNHDSVPQHTWLWGWEFWLAISRAL